MGILNLPAISLSLSLCVLRWNQKRWRKIKISSRWKLIQGSRWRIMQWSYCLQADSSTSLNRNVALSSKTIYCVPFWAPPVVWAWSNCPLDLVVRRPELLFFFLLKIIGKFLKIIGKWDFFFFFFQSEPINSAIFFSAGMQSKLTLCLQLKWPKSGKQHFFLCHFIFFFFKWILHFWKSTVAPCPSVAAKGAGVWFLAGDLTFSRWAAFSCATVWS